MRVNIYEEEISKDVEIVQKIVEGKNYTGLRMFLYLPVTVPVKEQGTNEILGYNQHQGKFMHSPNDDDSSAVTFWAEKGETLKVLFERAIKTLDERQDDIAVPVPVSQI